MRNKELIAFKKKVKIAVANYIVSEGCRCCAGSEHEQHQNELGKLLGVKKYYDNSGYDFHRVIQKATK